MAKIITQFTGDSPDQARKAFEDYLKEPSKWLSDILYDIKHRWIDNGAKITDILIRENLPIQLAAVKAYVKYTPKPKEFDPESGRPAMNNWVPTKGDMVGILEKFYELSPMEKENRREGDYSGLNIDFSFAVDGLGVFRTNFSEDINGYSMSIRMLSYELPGFDMINYPETYVQYIKGIVSKAKQIIPSLKREQEGEPTEMQTITVGDINVGGLILHVGPTGSGKTTAIAAEISYFAESTTGAIVTYENPVEYRYIATKAQVRQSEIGKHIKKDKDSTEFENITRQLLRINPSIVLIGEARTREEIMSVLDIASRGHLVFATIHASNVIEALSILFSAVKEDKHLLASTLKAVVAHKLIRSQAGKIYGLHEILMVDKDKTIRQALNKDSNEALEQIRRIMYHDDNEITRAARQTFSQALDALQRSEKIDSATAIQIRESNYMLFEK